jgi:hypothetical protein
MVAQGWPRQFQVLVFIMLVAVGVLVTIQLLAALTALVA